MHTARVWLSNQWKRAQLQLSRFSFGAEHPRFRKRKAHYTNWNRLINPSEPRLFLDNECAARRLEIARTIRICEAKNAWSKLSCHLSYKEILLANSVLRLASSLGRRKGKLKRVPTYLSVSRACQRVINRKWRGLQIKNCWACSFKMRKSLYNGRCGHYGESPLSLEPTIIRPAWKRCSFTRLNYIGIHYNCKAVAALDFMLDPIY